MVGLVVYLFRCLKESHRMIMNKGGRRTKNGGKVCGTKLLFSVVLRVGFIEAEKQACKSCRCIVALPLAILYYLFSIGLPSRRSPAVSRLPRPVRISSTNSGTVHLPRRKHGPFSPLRLAVR